MIPRLLFSNLSEKNNTLDKKQKHYLKNVLKKNVDKWINRLSIFFDVILMPIGLAIYDVYA